MLLAAFKDSNRVLDVSGTQLEELVCIVYCKPVYHQSKDRHLVLVVVEEVSFLDTSSMPIHDAQIEGPFS